MSRQGLQTVTDDRGALPVLVPAEKGERKDGIANFFNVQVSPGVTRSDTRAIRLITDQDIQVTEKLLGPELNSLLIGALQLKEAFEMNDELLMERGHRKVLSYNADNPDEIGDLPNFFASHPGWAGLRFPAIVTETLKGVRLVMWLWPERKKFSPALFCPDVKTGVFLKALIDIRSCPYCSTLFVPEKENIIYCSLGHREAYRMARWRFKNKRGRGASHGSRKTR